LRGGTEAQRCFPSTSVFAPSPSPQQVQSASALAPSTVPLGSRKEVTVRPSDTVLCGHTSPKAHTRFAVLVARAPREGLELSTPVNIRNGESGYASESDNGLMSVSSARLLEIKQDR
jgi:hypothetical protein